MRAGKTAQWLGALAAVAEDPGSVPSSHTGGGGKLTTICNSGRYGILFWFLQAPAHM